MPHSIHISKIRDRGCIFATKTGRVAIENSVLGIPTILYGYPFYGIGLPLTFHVSKLPSKLTCGNIHSSTDLTLNPELAVKNYLTDKFSGSIENPGISIERDASATPIFENDFRLLLKKISME